MGDVRYHNSDLSEPMRGANPGSYAVSLKWVGWAGLRHPANIPDTRRESPSGRGQMGVGVGERWVWGTECGQNEVRHGVHVQAQLDARLLGHGLTGGDRHDMYPRPCRGHRRSSLQSALESCRVRGVKWAPGRRPTSTRRVMGSEMIAEPVLHPIGALPFVMMDPGECSGGHEL